MESHSHYASSVTTKTWKHKVNDTVSMVEMLKNPGDKKSTSRTPCIFFGRLQDGVRSKDTVLSKSAIVLDADHAQIFFEDFTEMALDAWEHFMHTTYSSTPEAPRYRLIVPLAEDVTPAEYTYLADILMAYLSKGEPDLFDKTAREPSRLFFAPAANPKYRDSYSYVAHKGRLMKASEIEALNLIAEAHPAQRPHRPAGDVRAVCLHRQAGRGGNPDRAFVLTSRPPPRQARRPSYVRRSASPPCPNRRRGSGACRACRSGDAAVPA